MRNGASEGVPLKVAEYDGFAMEALLLRHGILEEELDHFFLGGQESDFIIVYFLDDSCFLLLIPPPTTQASLFSQCSFVERLVPMIWIRNRFDQ